MQTFFTIYFWLNILILLLVEASRFFTKSDMKKITEQRASWKISQEEFDNRIRLIQDFEDQSPIFSDFESHSLLVFVVVLFWWILLSWAIITDIVSLSKK